MVTDRQPDENRRNDFSKTKDSQFLKHEIGVSSDTMVTIGSLISFHEKFLVAVLLVVLSFPAYLRAQASFERFYGTEYFDEGHGVEQTADGGYVVVGFYGASSDVFLIKMDTLGDMLWTRKYGGSDIDDAWSVRETADGGMIIAGYTYSFTPGADLDVYLVRTDVNGQRIWQRNYPLNGFGLSIDETTDGGFAIAGDTDTDGAFLMKTDSVGDITWTRTYGGSGMEDGSAAQQTEDGGFIIIGRSYSLSFGALRPDVYAIKTDVDGREVWARTYGGHRDDHANSVQQTTDGGYIIVGWTRTFGAGGMDIYLIKTDADGDTLWTRTYGGFTNDYGNSVQQTSDSGYVIAGGTLSFGAGNFDVYLVKTDSGGNTLWTQTFGSTGEDYASSVRQTDDGGYIVAGYSDVNGGDIYVVKTEGGVTSVDEEENNQVPASFYLAQNYPNPFNPRTVIPFQVAKEGFVTLSIYNVLGQKIITLVNGWRKSGRYQVEWSGKSEQGNVVPSGIYLYILKTEGLRTAKRMLLIK
jgi:hypothetical protein